MSNLSQTLKIQAEKLDNSNMAEVIRRTPYQIESALTQSIPSVLPHEYKEVIFVGVGGSSLPANVAASIFLSEKRIPIKVHRNYAEELRISEDSLVIISSFSGNTEETLSILPQITENASNIITISAGGQLKERSFELGIPHIEIPAGNEVEGFQPRCATGYFVTYHARILHGSGLISNPYDELESISHFLRDVNVKDDASTTAMWLSEKIPIIYTDGIYLDSVARIAKIKFNENSKRPAFYNVLPEANHNEMIGFSTARLADFGLLYLHDPDSHPSIRKRFEVMKKTFELYGLSHVDFAEWRMRGKSRGEKIFCSLMFADWCSYFVALLDGFDPTPVALVEEFKKAMK